MQVSGYEGIAHTHRVDNGIYIIYARRHKTAGSIKQSGERMMARCYLVARGQNELLAAWKHLVNLIEIILKRMKIHRIIGRKSFERHTLHARNHLVFALVAEDYVGVRSQFCERLMRVGTIIPQILAIIDVARDCQPHLLGYLHSLHRCVGRTLRERTGDATAMENTCIVEHFAPRNHARLHGIECRILTVIDHTRVAHGRSILEIITSQPVSATANMTEIQSVAMQVHTAGTPHGIVGNTRHILNIVAQHC